MGRPLAIMDVNPPEEVSGEVHAIEYKHNQDGEHYRHDFGPGVRMEAEKDGSVTLSHAGGRGLHRDHSGQTFLINPPKRGKRKMARRRRALPPRYRSGPKRGQFRRRQVSAPARRRRRRRRNQPAVAAKAYPRPAYTRKVGGRPRRTNPCNRRNPPRITMRNIMRTLTEGAMDAGLVLTGKAATRSIPLMANLPKEGNIGLAVQGLTAVVVSMLAQNFLRPQQARMILAGGLTAPLETLIVSFNVPFLGPALQPVESDAQLSAYLGGYVQPPPPAPTNGEAVGGYVDNGMGDYAGDPEYWAYA